MSPQSVASVRTAILGPNRTDFKNRSSVWFRFQLGPQREAPIAYASSHFRSSHNQLKQILTTQRLCALHISVPTSAANTSRPCEPATLSETDTKTEPTQCTKTRAKLMPCRTFHSYIVCRWLVRQHHGDLFYRQAIRCMVTAYYGSTTHGNSFRSCHGPMMANNLNYRFLSAVRALRFCIALYFCFALYFLATPSHLAISVFLASLFDKRYSTLSSYNA